MGAVRGTLERAMCRSHPYHLRVRAVYRSAPGARASHPCYPVFRVGVMGPVYLQYPDVRLDLLGTAASTKDRSMFTFGRATFVLGS